MTCGPRDHADLVETAAVFCTLSLSQVSFYALTLTSCLCGRLCYLLLLRRGRGREVRLVPLGVPWLYLSPRYHPGLWVDHTSSPLWKAAPLTLSWLVFIERLFQVGGTRYAVPALKAPGDELSWTGLLSPFPDWILLPLPFPQHFLDNETPALGFA